MQIASEFPPQSDATLLISYHFTISSLLMLTSMVWFVFLNLFTVGHSIPALLERFLDLLMHKRSKKKVPSEKIQESEVAKLSPNETISCYLDNSEDTMKSKCNNCAQCKCNSSAKAQKKSAKKKEKEHLARCEAMNLIAFCFIVFVMLSFELSLWLCISWNI